MIRIGFVLLLFCVLSIGLAPSAARAHGIAEPTVHAAVQQLAAVQQADSGAVDSVFQRLDRSPSPHDHRPGKPGCLVACSGAGTIAAAEFDLPIPIRVAPVVRHDTANSPTSVEPPVEDQPPRAA